MHDLDLSGLAPAVADIIRLIVNGDMPADPEATIRALVELMSLLLAR
jgi:hypothetical protein